MYMSELRIRWLRWLYRYDLGESGQKIVCAGSSTDSGRRGGAVPHHVSARRTTWTWTWTSRAAAYSFKTIKIGHGKGQKDKAPRWIALHPHWAATGSRVSVIHVPSVFLENVGPNWYWPLCCWLGDGFSRGWLRFMIPEQASSGWLHFQTGITVPMILERTIPKHTNRRNRICSFKSIDVNITMTSRKKSWASYVELHYYWHPHGLDMFKQATDWTIDRFVTVRTTYTICDFVILFAGENLLQVFIGGIGYSELVISVWWHVGNLIAEWDKLLCIRDVVRTAYDHLMKARPGS